MISQIDWQGYGPPSMDFILSFNDPKEMKKEAGELKFYLLSELDT